MSNPHMRTLVVAVLSVALLAPAFAQTPTGPGSVQTPAATPRFEVASVKPSAQPDPGIGGRLAREGRFARTNAPVQHYIQLAFNLPQTRIIGAPDWVRQERFDITATYDPAFDRSFPQMLQGLLEDRFRLVARRQSGEIQVYELLPMRADGLVPNVRATTVECRPAEGKPSPCRAQIGPGRIDAVGMAWEGVPLNLGISDRPIVDRTGISGRVDVTLDWLPDPGGLHRAAGAARSPAAARAGRDGGAGDRSHRAPLARLVRRPRRLAVAADARRRVSRGREVA
jgi:uncharacterized protein (TIGR03435 family)